MEVRRIEGFSGTTPKIDRKLLQPSAAQNATNVFLTSGRIDPMTAPKNVQLLDKADPKTIYRMFDANKSIWLSWQEQVDVAESPVYVENGFRIAFTSPEFEPRQTDLNLASSVGDGSSYPSAWYVLGVTPPITAPTVSSVTDGSGTNVTRTYVYTFANQWGEESAPSPASTVFAGLPDGIWNLTLPDTAPANSYTISDVTYATGQLRLTLNTVFGLRAKEKITLSALQANLNASWRIASIDVANKYVFITMTNPGTITDTAGVATRDAPHNTTGMTKRLYRSVTNAEGTAFYLVKADIPAVTTTTTDTATVIGEVLETLEWAMPPADLEGIVTHPSGCMVGFRGNEVYISEPYAPYAYKLANVQVLDFPAVGMGVFAQSIIIGTQGKPYLLSFVSPETATPQKIDQNWPCVSKLGVVAFNGGVYYPTTVGLAFVGDGGAVLVTEQYYSQREWVTVNPDSFVAGYFDNRYYAAYTKNEVTQILVISDKEGVTTVNSPASTLFPDRESGSIYLAFGNFIALLHAPDGITTEFSWTSKEFIVPDPVNLGAAKIDFSNTVDPEALQALKDANAAAVISNSSMLGDLTGLPGFTPVSALEVNASGLTSMLDTDLAPFVTFTLLVDNAPYFQKVVTDTKVFRLPTGRKYDRYAIRLSGTTPVTSVVVGDTPITLKRV